MHRQNRLWQHITQICRSIALADIKEKIYSKEQQEGRIMELKFENIDGYKNQVKKLFVTAFPREERPPMWMLTRRCRQGLAEFRAVVHEDRFVGLIYVIGDERIKTLMFLAIAEDARGGGYGSEILKRVRENYPGVKLFLNIEPLDRNAPNYEQRCRRKKFYERNGLTCLDYQVREAGVTYEMMTYGEYVSKDEYEETMQVMYGRRLYKLIKRM